MRPLLLVLVLAGVMPAGAQQIVAPKPNYCFGLLKAVPNRPDIPAAEAQRIQREHLAHMSSLAEKRWLVAAGPIVTAGSAIRGILISKCQSVEEASAFASADPAVKSGRLSVETFGWAGPEGIGERYRAEKAANPDSPDRMLKHPLVLLKHSRSGAPMPAKEVLQSHVANVSGMTKSGKLAAAGPFSQSNGWIGAFVFRPAVSADEAKQLVEKDPFVASGYAQFEVYEWLSADGVFPSR